ncbi:MAG: tRNA (5-methylaminomethyl-2-thiouridine)(34)-methyltransferase MnmD [Bacteroidota bacterium]|nr:tRNA (5-methylaminomethyl-2-thiouridine)(34)-methyltransferase MnmD [Bacteroidota bacterium]
MNFHKYKREFILTSDGNPTILLPELQETYHSKKGAVAEAYHVFIDNGYHFFQDKEQLSILEFGFGTGLNALVTIEQCIGKEQQVKYTTIEAYPLEEKEYASINYQQVNDSLGNDTIYKDLHTAPWNVWAEICPNFYLKKIRNTFEDVALTDKFDLVYFDVFGYRVQPELWSEFIFKKVYQALNSGGILTTYACRKTIIENMKKAGFSIEKKQGACGKREMLIGFKE